jgi:sugar-specific transcriptional regulator TrmB
MAIFPRENKDLELKILNERIKETMYILRDINTRLHELHERIDAVERTITERLPPDILTERTFRDEVQSGDDIIKDIMSRVEQLSESKSIREVLEGRLDKPSPVEMRRIESITGLLQQHGKLNSNALSQHIGLSRTRCNEYFKQMENMGIVEPVVEGKEKFYRLS